MTTTISSKGQITVPNSVRRALGLSPGTRLKVRLAPRGGFLVTKDATEDFFGRFKGVRRKQAKWPSGDAALAALRDEAP
jgi:AbrB family looped-hinge helix DNA binding protein